MEILKSFLYQKYCRCNCLIIMLIHFQSQSLVMAISKEKQLLEEKLSSMKASVLQSEKNANSEGKIF